MTQTLVCWTLAGQEGGLVWQEDGTLLMLPQAQPLLQGVVDYDACMDAEGGLHILSTDRDGRLIYLNWNGAQWMQDVWMDTSGGSYHPSYPRLCCGLEVEAACLLEGAGGPSIVHYRRQGDHFRGRSFAPEPGGEHLRLLSLESEYGRTVPFLQQAYGAQARLSYWVLEPPPPILRELVCLPLPVTDFQALCDAQGQWHSLCLCQGAVLVDGMPLTAGVDCEAPVLEITRAGLRCSWQEGEQRRIMEQTAQGWMPLPAQSSPTPQPVVRLTPGHRVRETRAQQGGLFMPKVRYSFDAPPAREAQPTGVETPAVYPGEGRAAPVAPAAQPQEFQAAIPDPSLAEVVRNQAILLQRMQDVLHQQQSRLFQLEAQLKQLQHRLEPMDRLRSRCDGLETAMRELERACRRG